MDEARPHLVVDAMNVIGSRPTGWWRDRDGAVRRLVTALQRLAAVEGDTITVVLDGRPLADLPEGEHEGVLVLYGAGGRDGADDRIVEWLGAADGGSRYAVVTSDRRLAERARELGADVGGPRWLLGRLDAVAQDREG